MKFLVCLSCVLAVAVCSPTDINEWEDFKNLYGKSYETQEEEAYRNSVFKNSQKIVEEHNAKFDQGLISYNLKINEHADRTWEEFSATMKGLIMGKTQSVNVFQYDKNAETNHTVDWRTKGAVTPVKNQQQCGSCWAFSTTGSLEGQHFLKTNKLVSLSEQNLVDCSMDFGNLGCMGGLMDNAFKYIKSNKGIDTEDSYPYEAKNGKCRFDAKNVGATITGYTDIPKGDEKALQHAVDKVGPISVAIDASGSDFQLYHSGVYYNKDCSSTQLDHGVLAVGLGEEDGKKYWLVKNSWGQSWGQDGYIMMSRDKDNNCGIATSACFPLV